MKLDEIPISEQHVDKIWCAYLLGSSDVRSRLLAHVNATSFADDAGGTIVGVRVSVLHTLGETDVLAEWRDAAGKRLVLLIEDKLTAAFQPSQGRRYLARANELRRTGCEVRTVLVAPAAYLNGANPESRYFDHALPLQAALSWMDAAKLDAQAIQLDLVREGLQRAVDGVALGAKGLYVLLHRAIADECERRDNGLYLTANATEWVFMSHASLATGVEIRYRIKMGHGEFAFTKDFRGNLRAVIDSRPHGWNVVVSGKNTHVRNPPPLVSAIARKGDPSPDEVRRIVESIEGLLDWWTRDGVAAAQSLAPSLSLADPVR